MSIAADIKAAAVTAIEALSLSPTPSVTAAKTPILPSGVAPPAVRVSCSRGGRCEVLTATTVVVTYMLTVALYAATTGETGDADTLETWRQSVNRKLDDRAAFATVAGFNEIFRMEGVPFSPAGFEGLTNVSILTYACEVIESRN